MEVRFDALAIPHVYAHSSDDAMLALGYLQARDRLWQMELYRRAASGRLAEIFGEDLVAVDQGFLALGFRRAAHAEWNRAAPEARRVLERYSAGVTAAIAEVGVGKLPVEFQLLRLRPEPWSPIDSLAIGKLFAWRLGENHAAELLRYVLRAELGSGSDELLGGMPSWAPQILADGSRPAAGAVTSGRSGSVARAGRFTVRDWSGLAWLSDDHHGASNSWVVAGNRTATGRPLLVNDPHLTIEMPSVWWEVHLFAERGGGAPLNVSGAAIPGLPSVVIGHNERIGWGLTNSGADVQDFYVERLDPVRQRYLDGSDWVPLTASHYDIHVKGRTAPIGFDVYETRHGPVLNAEDWNNLRAGQPPLGGLHDTALALRWDAIREGDSVAAFIALARADGWPAFLAAVRNFYAPSQLFAYADVDGNIGTAMSGLLPMRTAGEGTSPSPGWTHEIDWTGMLDLTALPSRLNPSSGQLVAANNEIDRGFPFLITRDWVAPFRAQRIVQVLADRRALDLPAMMEMQADITSLSADFLLKTIGAAIPPELAHWDRRVDARSESAFYEAFEEALWRRTFSDEMSPALYDRFYRYAANERFAGLHAIIEDRNSMWFDDRTTPNIRETRDDMVALAAGDARTSLSARFGAPASWRWDRIHALKFAHALAGGGAVLDWFFSRGPVPVAGDGMTVNKTATNLRRPYETSDAASYRQILDVGAWDRSVAVNTAGQSGHPASRHYFDQNVLWREGRYHPLPFSRAAVEASTASRLELTPGQ